MAGECFIHCTMPVGKLKTQNLEKCRGVFVGLLRQLVFASHDDALLQKVPDAGDDLQRREVARVTLVDVEDLLRVPDHPLQVARKDDLMDTIKHSNSSNLFFARN